MELLIQVVFLYLYSIDAILMMDYLLKFQMKFQKTHIIIQGFLFYNLTIV
jgi:hypothetical protein